LDGFINDRSACQVVAATFTQDDAQQTSISGIVGWVHAPDPNMIA
jgi:hypothetical protein